MTACDTCRRGTHLDRPHDTSDADGEDTGTPCDCPCSVDARVIQRRWARPATHDGPSGCLLCGAVAYGEAGRRLHAATCRCTHHAPTQPEHLYVTPVQGYPYCGECPHGPDAACHQPHAPTRPTEDVRANSTTILGILTDP